MPWTVRDVNRFKRGLSTTQKHQWVRIANGALRSCQARSGSNCEASAIRQANGVVGNSVISNIMVNVNDSYEIRNETFNGREYIVVPVVMMREGVHNGSQGPTYHSVEQLSKIPQAWNGIPITIQHPEDLDGVFISANSPQVLEEYEVGQVFSAHYEDGLRAEAWLDVLKLKQKSMEAYEHIMERRPLDVSLGMFSEDIDQEGQWQGEEYERIATNYRPNHLALLPGNVGACSWNDGCGIRVNNLNVNGGNNEMLIEIKKNETEAISVSLNVNEPGLRSVMQNLQSLLDSMDNDMKIHYLQEMYEDTIVFEVRKQGRSTLYRQSYQINEDESVELTGEAVEVRKQVEYVTAKDSGKPSKFKRTKNNFNLNTKEDPNMTKEGCEGCMEKVINLINNENTHFTKDDREWLLTQDEATLDKLAPVEVNKKKVEVNEKKDEKATFTKEQTIEALQGVLKTKDDFLKVMPQEMRDQMETGLALHDAKRKELVDSIINNTEKGVWTEEELQKHPTSFLEKIAKSFKETGNFVLNSGGQTRINGDGEEDDLPLPITGYAIKE